MPMNRHLWWKMLNLHHPSCRAYQRLGQRASQRGVALLILMTIILLAISTALVTQISVNDRRSQRPIDDAAVLDLVAQSLLGYALRQTVSGELPCPDTNGDGVADPQGFGCVDQLGLVPLRTLDLAELTDSTGAPLWYAVSLDLLANSGTIKNSSTNSSLTLDGIPVAAVVIAPGAALGTQSRTNLIAAQFLEGVNADADRDDYVNVLSDTQNDQVLAIRRESVWSLVESKVNASALALLQAYRTNCGEYPWAASFGGSADSVISQQSGALPLGTALPFDWGAVCGLSSAPAVDNWLATHWQDQLFYSMCTTAQGSCLSVTNGDTPLASAAVVSPGVELALQNRPGPLAEYFEDENADGDESQFVYREVFDHQADFNDTVAVQP